MSQYRNHNEYTEVEKPLIDQLQAMGWQWLEGDIDVPYLTDRETFKDVLLKKRLRQALARINVTEDGQPWLDDVRLNEAISALDRLGATSLIGNNQQATTLLLKGTAVAGHPDHHAGREQTIHYIDWHNPENNDFLVINQFRVDPPWAIGDKDFIIPDLVLFVNGIPLVVVECKNASITNPIEAAIVDLLKYCDRREETAEPEGAERLFYYNQFMVATSRYQAFAGTISSKPTHYLEWKDTAPVPAADVAAELGLAGADDLVGQHILAAGMLRPSHLLDIVRNFTLFKESGGQRIKIVTRYQQFRAVQKAIQRLTSGQSKQAQDELDQRGGIIWHTQGSGKSLTMVFLVRKMRSLPALRRFKVVVVTDRQDLQDQLGETAVLTNETVRTASSTDHLQEILSEPGPDLVFAMIQKYQERDSGASARPLPPLPKPGDYRRLPQAAEPAPTYETEKAVTPQQAGGDQLYPVLNESENILVLVDEAHRSQANTLHANLMRALPNCAKIGFTGTPIMIGDRKRTHEIFGPFIDKYTIKQSEEDGMTVKILYEGRTTNAEVSEGRTLDQLFEDMFQEYTPEEMEAIKKKYATKGNVLESKEMIQAKATDILRHYVSTVLPDGFKAQVVAVSRRAVVRYQKALTAARDELVARLEQLDAALLHASNKAVQETDPETQFLVAAHPHLDTIRGLQAAAVISGTKKDPQSWKQWSRRTNINAHIDRFKKPLAEDGLVFLCINSMLLTGFDAPLEQVLYLDRGMRGHELLQAIARVNRTAPNKHHGLVVDYYGVGQHLRDALNVYTEEDVEGALTSIRDELPVLEMRYRRLMNLFYSRGIDDIYQQLDQCVLLLQEERLRAEFVVKFKQFVTSLNIVLPRPEGLPYVADAKVLGYINKAAANLLRDPQLNMIGVGDKVRTLIDDHIRAQGIDPKVPPISIMDADFETAVDAHVSPQAKALEMEHAARYHISQHYREDPVYYQKLSERLEAILQQFGDNWDALEEALRQFTRKLAADQPTDDTGLDPKTQAPFMRVLVDEVHEANVEDLPPDELERLAGLSVSLVDTIRAGIRTVDFWRNTVAQNELRGRLIRYLDDQGLVDFTRLEKVADKLMEMAKAKHVDLTAVKDQ